MEHVAQIATTDILSVEMLNNEERGAYLLEINSIISSSNVEYLHNSGLKKEEMIVAALNPVPLESKFFHFLNNDLSLPMISTTHVFAKEFVKVAKGMVGNLKTRKYDPEIGIPKDYPGSVILFEIVPNFEAGALDLLWLFVISIVSDTGEN